MADSRINLLSSASSTASDDFFVVDGNTNGTRKLNAFSPTIGGNLAVTGTLTVNGTATLSSSGTNTVAGVIQFSNATPYLFPNAADKTLTIYGSSNANVGLTLYGDTHATKASQAEFIGSTLVRVLATTASTSTSTGALVVSGGVGVAGNINAGGTTFRLNSKLFGVGDGTTTYLYSQGSGGFILRNAADSADIFRITNAGVTSIVDTTASTTTSTGALVVGNGTSGGLGVGGAINAGGTLRVVGSSQIIRVRHDAATIDFTNTAQDAYVAATVIGNTLQLSGNNGNGILIGATGIATVQATTPSTSTSSGALVVGNGTSGGLGVGGAVNIGGTLSVLDGGTASSAGTIRLPNNTSIGWRNAANSADIFLTVNNSNLFSFGSGAPVYVNNTTASTSTSSGALVVSGGVGVAGKVNAGSFGTSGITLSAVQNVSVSTTAVDIATGTEVAGLYFVTGYNNADGGQGSWLVMTRGTSVTTISSNNNTGLTVTFSVRISGFLGILQAATASGTLITNATAFTR